MSTATALGNLAGIPRGARLHPVSPDADGSLRRIATAVRPDVRFVDDPGDLGPDDFLHVGGPAMHRDLDAARARGLGQRALICPEAPTSYYDFWSLPLDLLRPTASGGLEVAQPDFERFVAALGDFFGRYENGVFHHQGIRYQPWRRVSETDKQARLAAAVGQLAEDQSRDRLLAVLAQPPVELWRRWLKQVLNGLEYFDVVTLDEGDVVLNAGVHGGGEVPNFFARVGATGRVVNVDPLGDAYLSEFVKAAIAAFPGRCDWVAAALHDRDGTLDLPVEPGGMAAGNRIGEQIAGMTTRRFTARSIDSIAAELDLARLDLIKMDVEGAEPVALQGAMRTIERFRPQLAISIYHEPDHFLDIPDFLGRALADYRFYVRNYHFIANETILYAVPAGRRVQEPPQPVEIALV